MENSLNRPPPAGKEHIHEHAERLSTKIRGRHPEADTPNIVRVLRGILFSDQTKKKKLEAIERISARLMTVIDPYTPCGKGCDSCCHFAVIISQAEADIVARHVKVARADPPHKDERQREADIERYRNVPCPFLKDKACSVYAVRPFLCRQGHTINPNADECSTAVPGDESFVSWLPAIKLVEAMHIELQPDAVLADIREFFPDYRA